MGVDTKGYLNLDVTALNVFDVIVNTIDKDAQYQINKHDKLGESGYIYLQYNNERRGLFFYEKGSYTGTENEEIYNTLSLGHNNDAIEIITTILKHFGGYLDQNDCDEEDDIYIPKDIDFQLDDYLKQRNDIMNILDEKLSRLDKISVAQQIMKHKNELLSVLKSKEDV